MKTMTWMVISAYGAAFVGSSYAAVEEDCLPFLQPASPVIVENVEPVRYTLSAALLKPQLEALLAQHWGIQRVVWYADQHHVWPTDFELRAAHWDALLESLLAPYQLRVSLHPNAMAVIDYLPQAKQP